MKTNLITWSRRAGAGLLLGSMVLVAGCVAYGPGPGGYYDYYYYPDADVYFYPAGGIYYWSDGGHWASGRRLPRRYELREEHRQPLRLHSREPWTERGREHHEGDERR